MISRTHIIEILGLGDYYDQGDIVDIEMPFSTHMRFSSPWPKIYGSPADDTSYCKMRCIYRPMDGVLYTCLNAYIGLGAAEPYGQNAGITLSSPYADVFIPQKFYICDGQSRIEVDTLNILNNNIIAADGHAYTKSGVRQPTNPNNFLVTSRRDDYQGAAYTRTPMSLNAVSIYEKNYNKCKLTFSNVNTMTYRTPGVFMCEGWRITRNVIQQNNNQ